MQCQLRVMTTGETFDLHEGSNTIGRRANSDTADIQISNDMYMSRKHIIIDVVKQRNTLEYHLVEIGSKNITKLNGTAINRGDILILNPGDVMTLGTTEVRLEVIDNERTRLIN